MQKLKTIAKIAPLLIAFGCGDSGGNDVSPDAAPIDAPPSETRQITGTTTDTLVSESGVEMAPRDLSAVTIEAIVANGSGGFDVFPGQGAADGTFAIADVPVGPYLLRTDSRYVATSASSVDLGANRLGRASAVSTVSSPTNLVFDIDGMSAWQEGDRLDLSVPNNGSVEGFLDFGLLPEVAVDAVALTSTFDWSLALAPNLIESSAGDVAYLAHATQQLAGQETYTAISQFLELAPLAMQDGVPTTIEGTFADVALDKSVEVQIDPADWAAILVDYGPVDLFAPSLSAVLVATPFRSDSGPLTSVEIASYNPLGAEARTFSLAYSNPYPDGWTEWAAANMLGAGYLDPPANTALAISFSFANALASTLFADLKPRLTPPRAPQIDGKDFTAPQTSGPTPTLSWTAPATGTAGVYVIRVRRVGGVSPFGTTVARFVTTETSITLPPGIVSSGNRYFFDIGVRRDAGADYETAPFRFTSFASEGGQRPTAILTVE